MVVPPHPVINNFRYPLQVNKMSVSDFCMDLKPVEFQIDVEYRERVIPLTKVGLTGPYIVVGYKYNYSKKLFSNGIHIICLS